MGNKFGGSGMVKWAVVEWRKWGNKKWYYSHSGLPQRSCTSPPKSLLYQTGCDLPSSILSRTWMMSPSSKLTWPSPCAS